MPLNILHEIAKNYGMLASLMSESKGGSILFLLSFVRIHSQLTPITKYLSLPSGLKLYNGKLHWLYEKPSRMPGSIRELVA